jgi:predicted nucleic acid-binding protein
VSEDPTGTLVDSNVLIDIATRDPDWYAWSAGALGSALSSGEVAINPVIYAEVSVRFARIEAVERVIPREDFARLALPWDAAFLAGRAFVSYRRAGGARRSPLPDFYIGAHAAVAGMALLTRDASRYRTYFPKLRLISP